MPENIRRYSLFPKTLARSVEQAVKPVFKKHGFAEHRILTEWHSIVGAELAAYSIPQKLTFPARKKDGGTLHVLVMSGRALELQHMQPVIIDRIATYFGYAAVARLAFMQTLAPVFSKETQVAVKRKARPSAATAALVAECDDSELRGALLSLGAALATVEN